MSSKRQKVNGDQNGHQNVSGETDGKQNDESRDLNDGKIDDQSRSDNDDRKDEEATFDSLGLLPELVQSLQLLDFKKPTPIQAKSIPPALQGKDIIGLANTGSGKTAAYSLPILHKLWLNPSPFYALILAPTRELAIQVSEQISKLGKVMSVKVATIVGGMDMLTQSVQLSKNPHIIVATPGRLHDHLEHTKGFSLKKIKYLVIDEADKLLDQDFGPILDKLLILLPPGGGEDGRRTYLFSATMTTKVEKLQRASLTDPIRIAVDSKYSTVSTLIQKFIFVPFKYKETYLVYLLSDLGNKSLIIFSRTCNDSQRISLLLRHLGFKAVPLHGQMTQSARIGSLNKFKDGERKILVATDVAARGLDIPLVDFVINFDIPTDSKSYIHRVGRTARAGRSGKAYSLVTQYDVEVFLRIEAAMGKKIDAADLDKEAVMLLAERVGEAQRAAIGEMKQMHDKRKGSKGEGIHAAGGAFAGKRKAKRKNFD